VIVHLYVQNYLWMIRVNPPKWISPEPNNLDPLPPIMGATLIPDFDEYRRRYFGKRGR
jgi:hypothetical protein